MSSPMAQCAATMGRSRCRNGGGEVKSLTIMLFYVAGSTEPGVEVMPVALPPGEVSRDRGEGRLWRRRVEGAQGRQSCDPLPAP